MMGCQKEESVFTVLETCIDEVDVKDTLTGINQKHLIKITYYVSGCNTYKSHEELKGNNSSTFKLITYNPYEYDTEKVCLTGMFKEEKNIEFIPLTSGVYTLYFNDSSLVKKVIILKE